MTQQEARRLRSHSRLAGPKRKVRNGSHGSHGSQGSGNSSGSGSSSSSCGGGSTMASSSSNKSTALGPFPQPHAVITATAATIALNIITFGRFRSDSITATPIDFCRHTRLSQLVARAQAPHWINYQGHTAAGTGFQKQLELIIADIGVGNLPFLRMPPRGCGRSRTPAMPIIISIERRLLVILRMPTELPMHNRGFAQPLRPLSMSVPSHRNVWPQQSQPSDARFAQSQTGMSTSHLGQRCF
mmetsp:Transcript_27254/g.90619  ORF Transcript_27254/g.90619 Transcript_27254/m.90619 type:complete len:243 (+) Transcript_27254:235-963(+)